MTLLTKIRGLWRFDGDGEPVHVSRRSFLFMGGVVAAGAIVPATFAAPGLQGFDTLMAYRLEREQAISALFKERYRALAPALYEAPWLNECPMQRFWPPDAISSRSMRIPTRVE